MTTLNGFYPDCDGYRSEPVGQFPDIDNRRFSLDGSDWPVCGAELLDDYDHERGLTVLLRTLGRGDVGIYSTGEGDLTVKREW